MIASTASCVSARSTARKNTKSSDSEKPMTLNMMIATILDAVIRMATSEARMISMMATSVILISEVVLQSNVISIIFGIAAYSNRLFDSISQFYIDNVYDLASGGNMVNVILVDFRGMDTLFETLVFGLAGLGIFILLRLRVNKKGENEYEEHA